MWCCRATGTVDSKSGFILGMHANFDGRVDPFDINVEAAGNGDLDVGGSIPPVCPVLACR